MSRKQPGLEQPQPRWPPNIPDVIWAPVVGGALVALVGVIGLALGQPLLFPSLGPTAFLQVETPELPTARFRNTLVGHLIGLFVGCVCVLALGAQHAPGVLASHQLMPVRVLSAVLSIVFTLLGGYLLRAPHPPAAATTLLVALGGFDLSVRTLLTVMAGVLVVAVVGEGLRRARLGMFTRSP